MAKGSGMLLPAVQNSGFAWPPVALVWNDSDPGGVTSILKGLEYIFLAPIIFLGFVSICLYLRERIARIASSTDPVRPGSGVLQPLVVSAERHSDPMLQMMREVKAQIAGLMLALLLTNLISRILVGPAYTGLDLVAESVGMVICGSYYLILDRHSK
jgi:hypothetical protein